ncbi:MAG: efflux RND transporter permease subunit [Deltaproteobacteria bacterium]|nr:efflux RND transporter permease subunit [Deltaproteobacteria bacterium]
MRWLVAESLRMRVAVVALAAVFLVVGAREAAQIPVDVFPEFAPPFVEIQTEAPGLTSLEVEQLVTAPIETALAGTTGLATLRSKSVPGLSSVTLLFDDGSDLMRARQLVAERLQVAAHDLPKLAAAPAIVPPISSTSRVSKIGLTSKALSQIELSTLARWVIRPRLMAVRGVTNVAIWGERPRQLQVLVSPDRLAAHHVTLAQVMAAAGDASAIAAGGFVDTPNQRVAVTHRPTIRSAADLGDVVVVQANGRSVRLAEVADVVEGAPPPIGDAVIDGGPGLMLIVEKQPAANTLEVTRGLDRALEELAPAMRDVTVDAHIFRPAAFIETSIDNLAHATVVGCVLVVVILIGFLWSWRTALISVVAIPLSLLAATLVLAWRGASLNTMVLAGLVIALGEVVDDAIIDVENIVRRLREARAAGDTRAPLIIVLEASLEVRSAIVYATLIVLLVFLPVYFIPGLAGSFFRPLASAYALAVLSSMLVALVVTPAMSLLLLPRAQLAHAPPPLVRVLVRAYRRVLPALVGRWRAAALVVVALLALTAGAARGLGQEFLPSFKERDFLMHFVGKPGTSLTEMQRITTLAGRDLMSIPGVRSFGAHIGRAELSDEVVGVNFTELWISVDPEAPYDATVAGVEEAIRNYPGLYRDVLTYLRERIKEVLTGASATVVVRIYGPALDGLRERAAAVAAAIGDVPGVANLKVEPQVDVPQLEVRPRAAVIRELGLGPGEVRRIATTLVQGSRVGEIRDDLGIVPIVVRGAEAIRGDVEAVRRLPIEAPGGAIVPLSQLADVELTSSPNVVQREAGSRRIDVTCDVAGRDLGAVARDIERRVTALPYPTGYHPQLLGEYEARKEAQQHLVWLGVLAFVGIVLVLYQDFRTVRLTALVILTLPFALVGGVAAAMLAGGVLSLGSLVGFVTVLGIAARNGIMLVSHYRHLEEHEHLPDARELVLRGSEERLAPILMTALATSLALVPLVLGGERPGHEIEHPLAVVILGGLVTSTLLNLFLLPALYLRFGSRSPRAQTQR